MLEIIEISTEDLAEAFVDDAKRLDVLLTDDSSFLGAQISLSQQHSLTLVTLETSDLHSQMSTLQGLYQVLYEELPSGDEDALDLVELIEEELGELGSCVLVVKDFSNCTIESQASLLELVIVSRAFKLLLILDKGFDFQENSQLWGVLADRTRMLQGESGDDESGIVSDVLLEKKLNLADEGFENEQGLNSDDNFNYSEELAKGDILFDPQVTQPIASYQDVELDDDLNEDRDESWDENDDIENEEREDEDEEREGTTVWYKLIPKYHLAAVVLLALLVGALWQMDLSKNKEQEIGLDDFNAKQNQVLENSNNNNNQAKPQEPVTKTEEGELKSEVEQLVAEHADENLSDKVLSNHSDAILENNDLTPKSSQSNRIENQRTSPESEPITNHETVTEITDTAAQNAVEEIATDEPVVKSREGAIRPDENKNNESKLLIKYSKVNWAPYQSNTWINGKLPRYYTMQIMASHNAEGIKEFLSGYGVNSNYAVYSTEKNGQPWHVVIYGVYESHEFAAEARKRLPNYLTTYSPWIRTFQSVQNSLK